MAQYLISVWHDDAYDDAPDWSDPDLQRVGAQVGALNDEMQSAGVWVFGAGLLPTTAATTFRPEGGEVSVTDGPYAESKEQMGGFWVIDVADLDAAMEWARKGAAACEGPVELRPMQSE